MMEKYKVLRGFAFLALLILEGCTGHLRYSGVEVPRSSDQPRAYVVNPELQKEFKILEYADLYQLELEPNAPIHIRLQPIESNLFCGNPIFASALTLGILPVTMPDTYYFRFEETRGSTSHVHVYELRMHYTYSLYERLRLFSDADEELGNALRAAANTASQRSPDGVQRNPGTTSAR